MREKERKKTSSRLLRVAVAPPRVGVGAWLGHGCGQVASIRYTASVALPRGCRCGSATQGWGRGSATGLGKWRGQAMRYKASAALPRGCRRGSAARTSVGVAHVVLYSSLIYIYIYIYICIYIYIYMYMGLCHEAVAAAPPRARGLAWRVLCI